MFKDLDRTGWIVVVSCGAGLALWYTLVLPKLPKPPPPSQPAKTQVVQGASSQAPAAPAVVAAPVRMDTGAMLKTAEAEFHFTKSGGGVAEAKILDQAKTVNSKERIVLNEVQRRNPEDRPHPIGALGERGAVWASPAYDLQFDASDYAMEEVAGKTVTLRGTFGQNLGVTKVFSLPTGVKDEKDPEAGKPDEHLLEMEITLENKGVEPVDLGRLYVYAGAASAVSKTLGNMDTGLVYQNRGKVTLRRVDWFKGFLMRPERLSEASSTKHLDWVALQSQFFTTIVRPLEPGAAGVWARPFPATIDGDLEQSKRMSSRGIEGAVGLPEIKLAAGERRSFHYEVYMGPKEYARLKNLPASQVGVMVYDQIPIFGWMFGWLIRPIAQLLVQVLVFFQQWTGNAGIAVLMLTVVVRALMWPLHAKAHMTSKRMSLLTPKLNELKEKYPDDPQRLQQEQMKLWGEYGINPMGGCLPAFFQMPIFIGYFRMLQSAVELRHEPFLGTWIHDLSMPDTVLAASAWFGGFDLNLLPILMAATSYLQFAMMPKTGDPNQRIMFMMFPLMFLFFCYSYASALALYWTWSNLISAGQTWWFNKREIPPLVKKKGARRKSWMERLHEQAESAQRAQQQGGRTEGAKPAGRPNVPSLTSLSGRTESSAPFGERGPRKQKAKRKPKRIGKRRG